ncbi:GNAT family N-acetyltransferase [Amycolatopsis anabasis]|uniref:GNAT family N-acetyltransferase n=1 Tax=Amycolatopsis anabasis TaxID=1840409 RepID=UPI00131C2367|nr:GNAT family N-acetyltransferase [Amycolatopsis anabasis]
MNSGRGLSRLIREMVVFAWPSQAGQYPAEGSPGISYFRGDVSEQFGPGAYVDCLLYRGTDGTLIGILNHFPQDFPPHERAGAVTIQVRADRRREGIATELLQEALSRWSVDFLRQRYTVEGAAFAEAFISAERSRREKEGYDTSEGEHG